MGRNSFCFQAAPGEGQPGRRRGALLCDWRCLKEAGRPTAGNKMEETQAVPCGLRILIRTSGLLTYDPAPPLSPRDSEFLTLSEKAAIFY